MAASFDVHAVGFGRVAPNAILGQPLNVLVPIQLDQGERLFAECVKAEVMLGDNLMAPGQVRVSVQPTASPTEWMARITTVAPIDEPVVEVTVSAGCERRFVRRFTAFADPPTMLSANALASQPPLESRPLPPYASTAPSMARANRPRNDRPMSAGGPSALRRSVERPVSVPRLVDRPKLAPAPLVVRDSQVARLMLDVGGSRLRMDIEDPVFMPAGAVAAGASGALADTAAEADRLQLLEKALTDLKRESQATRVAETGLKSRLADAESRGRALPWLLGLLLLATGVAAWLALRLRAQTHARSDRAGQSSQWWGGSAGAPPADSVMGIDSALTPHAPEKVVAVRPAQPDDGDGLLAAEPAVVAEVTPDTMPIDAHSRTVAFAGPMTNSAYGSIVDGALPAREVSVEELLDLEQQADFFIALGQEDAAIDLLMSHLRSSGGQSPLPYTKLLEIYRRQGDRSAYERIRARFNRRFNAYAPDWDVGPLHGRSLEDYPDVVQRLQGLWSSPLNAMAVLEAMLFRNDERQELFDLPAYKDVLLLYSLARDLYQQEGITAADVDLLLPLGDDAIESASGPLSPTPVDNGYQLTSFSLETPTGERHGQAADPKA